MVLAATPNQNLPGHRLACSTATIKNESLALMQCSSVLSAPTLMCHFYSLNALLQVLHLIWTAGHLLHYSYVAFHLYILLKF